MSVVKQKREEAGLGQEQLARDAGISVFRLSRIETGKQELQWRDAFALAKVLRCTALDLLPELKNALTEELPSHA